MTESHPPVCVALIANPAGEHLWTWDAAAGAFGLPAAAPRPGEPTAHAARRAAAAALGVPARVGHHVRLEPELVTAAWSRADVFRADPHPDFVPRPPVPHLWLAPHRALAGDYDPLAPESRWAVAALVRDGFVPGRSQATGVVVLSRVRDGRREFLLRHEPGWGYSLPTKRRAAGQSYAAAAARVLADELGIPPGSVVPAAAREAVVTARDRSRSEGVETFYLHGVFEADAPTGLVIRSARPAVWADARTILEGAVHDRLTPDGRPAPDAGVSPTAVHILQELDRIPAVVLP